jgi:subtilisin-like proprotein convertase family protein
MKKFKAIILLALLGAAAPLLLEAQTTESYTFTTNRLVPDGNASGLSDVRNLNSAIGIISSVQVRLKITGEFNGDLYGYLRHTNGFTVLLNRPGKTASDSYGYSDSGFNVSSFQTGATNGDIHIYQNVTIPAAGSPLIGTWQPDGRDVDPATVTDASTRSTSLTNFNSLNAAGGWTLYLADLESGGTNMLTEWGIDITGASFPALTWTNPADIVYGTALGGTQLNGSAIYNSTNVPGTFTYAPAAGTVLSAGLGQTLTVTFTPNDTNSFLPISTNVTINVATAPLTITANNTNKACGAPLPTFTASYSGFVNSDTPASLNTPVTLASTATASSPVGTYTITASGAAGANYDITFVDGILTVYNSNQPPVLSMISNVVIRPDGGLLLVTTASDPDGDRLTFSLDPGAPAGAIITNGVPSFYSRFHTNNAINSTNGTLVWTPTRARASTTNFFTVRVTDDGVPPMSATQTFMVTVLDYLEVTVGSTNVIGGLSTDVPIYLASSDDVTNLMFTIQWPASRFTNSALAMTAPMIGSAFLQDRVTNLLIAIQMTPGQVLQTTQQIAQLSFLAVTNQTSAFVHLPVASVSAIKPDGAAYTNYITHPGTVAVVTDKPLLAADLSTNSSRSLTAYGNLGINYQLQYTTNLSVPGWYPLLNYTQTNGAITISVDSTNPIIFYRLYEP